MTFYNETSPIVKKFLQLDGSITDGDGNLIYPANSTRAKQWQDSSPIVNKLLNRDGSLSSFGELLFSSDRVEYTNHGQTTVEGALDTLWNKSSIVDGEVDYYSDLPTASEHEGETYLVKKYDILTPTKLTGLYYCDGTNWDRRTDRLLYSTNAFTAVNKLVKTNDTNRQVIETAIEIDSNNNLDIKDGGLKDTFVSTAIKLGDALNTSFSTVNKSIVGAINEILAFFTNIFTNANTWTGIQTFSSSPIVPTPTTDMQASTKKYVDDNISGAGIPIGSLMHMNRTDVPEGFLRCDGTEYTKSAFSTFFTSYLVGAKIPTVSYATYASEISANGVCGSFALDEVGETFKTPTITGSTFIAQALLSGDIAGFVSAGLPNITGDLNTKQNQITPYGAFKWSGSQGTVYTHDTSSFSGDINIKLDASLSNPIYGNSTTVTPAHIKYPLFVRVSNTVVPASEAEYNAFIDGLTNKAHIDLSNLSVTGQAIIDGKSPLETTSVAVGQTIQIYSNANNILSLPAGGTWVVLSYYSISTSSGVLYRNTNLWGELASTTIFAGGTKLAEAASNFIHRAIVKRIA